MTYTPHRDDLDRILREATDSTFLDRCLQEDPWGGMPWPNEPPDEEQWRAFMDMTPRDLWRENYHQARWRARWRNPDNWTVDNGYSSLVTTPR